MTKRIGTVTVLVLDRGQVPLVNTIISEFSHLILCRQGLPLQGRGVAVITLIVEGVGDEINALTGKLGRLSGIQAKSVLTNQLSE